MGILLALGLSKRGTFRGLLAPLGLLLLPPLALALLLALAALAFAFGLDVVVVVDQQAHLRKR
jgi:hypothetical protein